jgi:tRNA-dihydrouridine synthase C
VRGPPQLALAPMEGISDAIVRDLLSALGGMDGCVTEFIRVAQAPVSVRVLEREVPELARGGRTPAGTPVMVQLLGGDAELVAATAARCRALGALGIDLNFGCPARRVNGSDGGAALLRAPRRIFDVVQATRRALEDALPVSAKIRLGWSDPDDVFELVRAADRAGASWITIHGRTKTQMYGGAADWDRIGAAVAAVRTPIVANGDLFSPNALARCKDATKAAGFMVGRGAFRVPNQFRWMRGLDDEPWAPERSVALLDRFVDRVLADPRFDRPERAAVGRLKQWVRALGEADPRFATVFASLKRAQSIEDAQRELDPLRRGGLASRASAQPDAA